MPQYLCTLIRRNFQFSQYLFTTQWYSVDSSKCRFDLYEYQVVKVILNITVSTWPFICKRISIYTFMFLCYVPNISTNQDVMFTVHMYVFTEKGIQLFTRNRIPLTKRGIFGMLLIILTWAWVVTLIAVKDWLRQRKCQNRWVCRTTKLTYTAKHLSNSHQLCVSP